VRPRGVARGEAVRQGRGRGDGTRRADSGRGRNSLDLPRMRSDGLSARLRCEVKLRGEERSEPRSWCEVSVAQLEQGEEQVEQAKPGKLERGETSRGLLLQY
jgi:hypothetical protein